jgi:hypothetical protein
VDVHDDVNALDDVVNDAFHRISGATVMGAAKGASNTDSLQLLVEEMTVMRNASSALTLFSKV